MTPTLLLVTVTDVLTGAETLTETGGCDETGVTDGACGGSGRVTDGACGRFGWVTEGACGGFGRGVTSGAPQTASFG